MLVSGTVLMCINKCTSYWVLIGSIGGRRISVENQPQPIACFATQTNPDWEITQNTNQKNNKTQQGYRGVNGPIMKIHVHGTINHFPPKKRDQVKLKRKQLATTFEKCYSERHHLQSLLWGHTKRNPLWKNYYIKDYLAGGFNPFEKY